ncbi:hypothetical protein, partial [Paenibacillus sp. sgz302251]|uniref:hypothetical protein n=1 Tax=Paenibacillus sp. sgz302251 TaxID=3414493 RepID=UPI003C7B05C6
VELTNTNRSRAYPKKVCMDPYIRQTAAKAFSSHSLSYPVFRAQYALVFNRASFAVEALGDISTQKCNVP